jgi:hypothetical protein
MPSRGRIYRQAKPTPFCFLFFCGLSLGAVPDGAGGFVPFTNSCATYTLSKLK